MANTKAAAVETHREQEATQPQDQQATSPASAEVTSLRFKRSKALTRTLWRAILGSAISIEQRSAAAFNKLVQKGANHQQNLEQQNTDNDEAATRLSAVERIHNFEHRIENRLDKGRNNTLHWIGIPNRDEFDQLNTTLLTLTERIQALEEKLPKSRKAK